MSHELENVISGFGRSDLLLLSCTKHKYQLEIWRSHTPCVRSRAEIFSTVLTLPTEFDRNFVVSVLCSRILAAQSDYSMWAV